LRFLDWLGSLPVAMKTLLQTLVSVLSTTFKSRQDLVLENLALRQQIEVLQRKQGGSSASVHAVSTSRTQLGARIFTRRSRRIARLARVRHPETGQMGFSGGTIGESG
jgi:hypothetical protein